jgi:putative transposase
VRFAFIHAEKAYHPIKTLCRNLEVSRQGYYAWRQRPTSPRVKADAELCLAVRKVFVETDARYGSPRVLRELRAQGFKTSKRAVERAMRAQGLTPPTPRRHRITTVANSADVPAPNDLDRNFSATRPNQRWVTDITYVWTGEGWAYLAAILDLFSRRVVGWALGSTLHTNLALSALESAIFVRQPDAGLLHHSDRGCQYTSFDYRTRLQELGVIVSMSRRGNCWDNAVAESFFATLKKELVHRRSWKSRADLREAVFEYIETFYNRRRLHSYLGYKSPAQFESDFALAA